MDHPSIRDEYLRKLTEYLKSVEITDEFMRLLENHPAYKPYIQEIDDVAYRKMVIFTEYTKDPDSCERLAQILHESGQQKPAQKLREFNKPIEPIDCTLDVEVTVQNATSMKSGGKLWYKMDANPRGKAFIFVGKDLSDRLLNEANRFGSIFGQLYFDVEIQVMDSCQEMITTLKAFTEREFTGDAVIVMYIGHGREEHIRIGHGDNIKLREIVDIFAIKKCNESLTEIPKIFIFNTCRRIPEDLKEEVESARTKCTDKVILFGMSPLDDEYYNKNIGAAYIISTCSEGYRAYYEFINGIWTTIFGRVFMQCLAQHSCIYNLVQLFNKTYADMAAICVIEQRPDMRQFNVTKDLYFNPGLPKNVDN